MTPIRRQIGRNCVNSGVACPERQRLRQMRLRINTIMSSWADRRPDRATASRQLAGVERGRIERQRSGDRGTRESLEPSTHQTHQPTNRTTPQARGPLGPPLIRSMSLRELVILEAVLENSAQDFLWDWLGKTAHSQPGGGCWWFFRLAFLLGKVVVAHGRETQVFRSGFRVR